MSEQYRAIHSRDVTNQIDLIDKNTSGIYLATLVKKEVVIYFKKKKMLLTIDVKHFGTYNIIQPMGQSNWGNIEIGNLFMFSKYIYKDKKTFQPKAKIKLEYISSKKTISTNIEIFELNHVVEFDSMHPRIVQLAVLDRSDTEYLIYTKGRIIRLHNDFLLDNFNDINL